MGEQRKSQMGAALGAIAFQLWQKGSDLSSEFPAVSAAFPAVPIHVSAAFTSESATFGLLGGLGIGGVALARLLSSKKLMDCATPHLYSTGGFLLGTALIVHLFSEPDMFEEPGIDALVWVRAVPAAMESRDWLLSPRPAWSSSVFSCSLGCSLPHSQAQQLHWVTQRLPSQKEPGHARARVSSHKERESLCTVSRLCLSSRDTTSLLGLSLAVLRLQPH